MNDFVNNLEQDYRKLSISTRLFPASPFNGKVLGIRTPFSDKNGKHIKVYITKNDKTGTYDISDGAYTIQDESASEVEHLVNDNKLKDELGKLNVIIYSDPTGSRVNNTIIKTSVDNTEDIPQAINFLVEGVILVNGVIPVSVQARQRESTLKEENQKLEKQLASAKHESVDSIHNENVGQDTSIPSPKSQQLSTKATPSASTNELKPKDTPFGMQKIGSHANARTKSRFRWNKITTFLGHFFD